MYDETGTFFIVQGATFMPFFDTGIHFSSTGNFLEGEENPMYNASLGKLHTSILLRPNTLLTVRQGSTSSP